MPAVPADRMYVALSSPEYSGAAACGTFLDVTGPKGTVRVQVVDQCHECEIGHLDLSEEAFRAIGDFDAGIIPISYVTVQDPAVPLSPSALRRARHAGGRVYRF
ncbi:expansin EXLX1 family cellulose-binding protein [Clavibacter michiganensis]|uniref:expansin EXLX1 family cellulose-binding protein n=1 Tax=Clavibacter michiganensis TaxID=28447 RepID=UPI0031F0B605